MPLVPCPSCRRHLKADEAACPFCRAALPKALAAGLTALALTGCPSPPQSPGDVNGGPPAPVTTASGGDEPPRDVYGAPPPPRSTPQSTPLDDPARPIYGAPPPR